MGSAAELIVKGWGGGERSWSEWQKLVVIRQLFRSVEIWLNIAEVPSYQFCFVCLFFKKNILPRVSAGWSISQCYTIWCENEHTMQSSMKPTHTLFICRSIDTVISFNQLAWGKHSYFQIIRKRHNDCIALPECWIQTGCPMAFDN